MIGSRYQRFVLFCTILFKTFSSLLLMLFHKEMKQGFSRLQNDINGSSSEEGWSRRRPMDQLCGLKGMHESQDWLSRIFCSSFLGSRVDTFIEKVGEHFNILSTTLVFICARVVPLLAHIFLFLSTITADAVVKFEQSCVEELGGREKPTLRRRKRTLSWKNHHIDPLSVAPPPLESERAARHSRASGERNGGHCASFHFHVSQ